jgi:hypothetical protein
MTLEELDRLLKQWRSDVTNAQTNLYALQRKLTYQILAGDPVKQQEPMKLKGISATKVAEALAAINTVDQFLPVLDAKIDEAQKKRDTEMPRFMQGGKIAEIFNMLNTESIDLPAVPVDLAQRGLLSASSRSSKARPKDLLDSMVDAFDRGSKVILKVESVWHGSKQKLDAVWDDLKQLEQKVNALGSEAARNELATARDALQNWQSSWELDPLGVSEGLDCLDKLRQRLVSFEQDKKTAANELDEARTTLARLKLLPNVDANRVSNLENSLNGIQSAFIKGDFIQVKSLLDAWRKAAADLETRKSTQTSTTPPVYTPGQVQTTHDTRVNVVSHPPLVREKSDLEKLVEGDVPLAPAPPAKTQQPTNPDLEKLVEGQGTTPAKTGDKPKPNAALTDLIEGSASSTTPPPAPGKTTTTPPAKPNDGLTDLINGNAATTTPPHPGTVKTAPPSKPGSDLTDLIEGKPAAPAKPAPTPTTGKPPEHGSSKPAPAHQPASGSQGSLTDLIEGHGQPASSSGQPATVPPKPKPTSDLTDLIEGKPKGGAGSSDPTKASAGKGSSEKPGGAYRGEKGSLEDLFK